MWCGMLGSIGGGKKGIWSKGLATIQEIESLFPLLVGTSYSEESAVTDTYNCIAFAFGDLANWWWPRRGYGCYWPPGFPLTDSVATLTSIFEVHGYSVCDNTDREPGYEKVVIYSREDRFKHAARQLESGRWASKLGEEQDIEHEKQNTFKELTTVSLKEF
jgi:hypothetical protein